MAQIESVLEDVKRSLGLAKENEQFDPDVMLHINASVAGLADLGLEPEGGFEVTGYDETWAEFIGTDKKFNDAKLLVFMQTKMIFDPNQTGFLTSHYEKRILELQWRIKERVSDIYQAAILDGNAYVWLIETGEPLPAEMAIGDIAYDPVTGQLWRKV